MEQQKSSSNKWLPADLYLYKSTDSDLLLLWDRFRNNKALGQLFLVALATSAMDDGVLSIGDLADSLNDKKKRKGERPVTIRIRINKEKYANLANLWQSLPRKSRSRTVIALIRSQYREDETRVNVGKLISQSTTVISGQVAEEIIMETRSTSVIDKTPISKDNQLKFPDYNPIDNLMDSLDG